MAHLVALAHADPTRAEQALPVLRRLREGRVLALEDACVVVCDRRARTPAGVSAAATRPSTAEPLHRKFPAAWNRSII